MAPTQKLLAMSKIKMGAGSTFLLSRGLLYRFVYRCFQKIESKERGIHEFLAK